MFIGHQKQIKLLEDSIKIKKVFQAYIFSGPEGLGKFSLARMFAEALIKNNPNILDGFSYDYENKNQDIEIIFPEKVEKKGVIKTKEIDVEKVRSAQKNLSLYPAIGNYRVLIINDAHRLTVSSQNALLKTLEEPSGSAIIILVTHEDGKILKTIKSRCQKVSFNLVSLEEIKNGFKEKIASGILEKATIFSMGKPGEMQKMIEKKERFESRDKAMRDLSNLRIMPVFEKFNLAENYSKNIMEARECLEFWVWMLRLQIFKNLENRISVEKNYKSIDKIREALVKIKNPSFNARLVLENLFLNL